MGWAELVSALAAVAVWENDHFGSDGFGVVTENEMSQTRFAKMRGRVQCLHVKSLDVNREIVYVRE